MPDEPLTEKVVVPRPLVCPACGSKELTTTSKKVDASAYWLCGKCGEVWNPGRRRERDRYGDYRR